MTSRDDSDRGDAGNALGFSDDELRLLRRVQRSEVWRCIEDMLVMERERLFAGTSYIEGLDGQPTKKGTLQRNRGAILFVQHLLREGPMAVIQSQRHRKQVADERVAKKAAQSARPDGERTYTPPRPGFEEKPEFDI